jgi:methylmalonyl-CoA mutase C-terminal domain/subunit
MELLKGGNVPVSKRGKSRAKLPIRVLIAKPGLGGHDCGAKVVGLELRDEGMEVIYTGIRQKVEDIVKTAVQEDVDVVGLSSLSGAHNHYFPKVVELLKEAGIYSIQVTDNL